MDLENKLNARQIVKKTGMSCRPEFFSGRGAITSDLNDQILEKIYKEIENEYGKKESKQFVKMIADIPKLSATDFLLNLYKLEKNNWKWNKRMLGSEDGVYVDGNSDDEKIGVGMATIASIFSGSNERDETEYIRNHFLTRH